MIRLGALFAGVGGLELGLENAFKVAGVRVETVYQVELDDAARKVLKAHWPHARHYADITAIETHSLPDADLIAGGFPCQDLSVAGRIGNAVSPVVSYVLGLELIRIVEEAFVERGL
jgi:DNA (cytosine-5)-methyltransferase 1